MKTNSTQKSLLQILRDELEPWEFIRFLRSEGSHMMHSEIDTVRKFTYEGIVTVRFSMYSHSRENADAEINRQSFMKELHKNVCIAKWRVKPEKVFHATCSEYGFFDQGHCHAIFSFDRLRKEGRRVPSLDGFWSDLQESTEFVRKRMNLQRGCVTCHWEPKYFRFGDGMFDTSDSRIAEYICKFDGARQHKNIIFSWSPKKIETFLGFQS